MMQVIDFEDSILYVKFISEEVFIVVTMNGTIFLLNFNEEISSIDVGEDVEAAHYSQKDRKLVIATSSGQVFIYDDSLEHINTIGGHSTAISTVEYVNGKVISMCQDKLIVNDDNGRVLYTLKAGEAYCYKYISDDIFCFSRDGKIQIFKQNKKIHELSFEEKVKCVEYLNKTLVLGGNFDYLLLIDMSGHYATYKLNIQTSVNQIKVFDDYKVMFVTDTQLIGIVDIRKLESLRFYESLVETIFDFTFNTDLIIVGGECGCNIIDIKENGKVPFLESN